MVNPFDLKTVLLGLVGAFPRATAGRGLAELLSGA